MVECKIERFLVCLAHKLVINNIFEDKVPETLVPHNKSGVGAFCSHRLSHFVNVLKVPWQHTIHASQ